MYGEELQVDRASVAIGVADTGDAGANPGGDSQFFIEFARQGLLGGLSELDFAAGKLPFEGHRLVGTPLADEDGISPQNEGSSDEAHRLHPVLFDIRGHVVLSLDA